MVKLFIGSLILAFSFSADAQEIGSHSLVLTQCSSQVVTLKAATTKVYLEKIQELANDNSHCEAMSVFGVMINSLNRLVNDHTPVELGQGYVLAISSAIRSQKYTPGAIGVWVDYYIKTIPDPERLSTVLRMSVEEQYTRFRGCERSKDLIDKVAQEAELFHEMYEVSPKSLSWQEDAKTVSALKNKMLVCYAMKRVREAKYMFMAKSDRGFGSLFKSHAEVERNVNAAGHAYFSIIESYRDVPIPPGELSEDVATFGELALSRLAELPSQFMVEGKMTNREWKVDGQELMQRPKAKLLPSKYAKNASNIYAAKIKLDQARKFLAAQQIDAAADLLVFMMLEYTENRFVAEANEELKKLEEKSLIDLGWASLSQRILKIAFESGEFSKARARFFGLTQDMQIGELNMPTANDLKLLEDLIAEKEKDFKIPQELTDIKNVILEIKKMQAAK